jgi:hypothetical protein
LSPGFFVANQAESFSRHGRNDLLGLGFLNLEDILNEWIVCKTARYTTSKPIMGISAPIRYANLSHPAGPGFLIVLYQDVPLSQLFISLLAIPFLPYSLPLRFELSKSPQSDQKTTA